MNTTDLTKDNIKEFWAYYNILDAKIWDICYLLRDKYPMLLPFNRHSEITRFDIDGEDIVISLEDVTYNAESDNYSYVRIPISCICNDHILNDWIQSQICELELSKQK